MVFRNEKEKKKDPKAAEKDGLANKIFKRLGHYASFDKLNYIEKWILNLTTRKYKKLKKNHDTERKN